MHTVLVVDDSQESLALARLLLRRRFRVMTAASAGGALGPARRERPDLTARAGRRARRRTDRRRAAWGMNVSKPASRTS